MCHLFANIENRTDLSIFLHPLILEHPTQFPKITALAKIKIFHSHITPPSLLFLFAPCKIKINKKKKKFPKSHTPPYLASTLASSPSTFTMAWGCFASMTKWLSQWGQYSSFSSQSVVSLRKHFLHFLHANVISVLCRSWWLSASAWHCAQSNHFLPGE